MILNKKQKKFNNTLTGFTLVETLVAIVILTVGIAAPLTAVSRALNSAQVAKDKISAFYFAQEGIEYIRHVRDTNILETDPWLDDLNRCLNANGCAIDDILTNVTKNNDFRNCGALGQCFIKFDGSLYGDAGGVTTKFRRVIKMDDTGTEDVEASIEVIITWSAKGKDHTYTLRETMFNWSGN